jgi:hypothetical protein
MDIIQNVFDMSEVILASEPFHVVINNMKAEELMKQMIEDGAPNFYDSEPTQEYKTGIHLDVLKELVASSINYNYWYGASDIRPLGCSSTTMYNDLAECFDSAKDHALNFEDRIESLVRLLSVHRYPLLEERKRHLYELCENRKGERFVGDVISKNYSPERLFLELVESFQGFATDQFLKRASLFFIQLHRKFGWYKDDLMATLFVPADYQVPKILRHFGVIEYSPELEYLIDKGMLIEKHSLMEIQIRAATVKACTQLQYGTGWTIADVDTYLWTKRKLTDKPFHLTYTTDY